MERKGPRKEKARVAACCEGNKLWMKREKVLM